MANFVLSISVNEIEKRFLEENSFSPTQLMKEKIHELMALNNNNDAKVKRLGEIIQSYVTFLEKNNLIDKYLAETS